MIAINTFQITEIALSFFTGKDCQSFMRSKTSSPESASATRFSLLTTVPSSAPLLLPAMNSLNSALASPTSTVEDDGDGGNGSRLAVEVAALVNQLVDREIGPGVVVDEDGEKLPVV